MLLEVDEALTPFHLVLTTHTDAFVICVLAVAHKKLSELGVEWEEGAPVRI